MPLCLLAALARTGSTPSSGCVNCHLDTFGKAERSPLVHQPFLEQQCEVCHLADEGTSPADRRAPVENAVLVEPHPPLKSKRATNLDSCRQCHEEAYSHYSHPVDVPPKWDMSLPRNSPLLTEGIITCISCHDPHHAEINDLLIASAEGELCVTCHQGH